MAGFFHILPKIGLKQPSIFRVNVVLIYEGKELRRKRKKTCP